VEVPNKQNFQYTKDVGKSYNLDTTTPGGFRMPVPGQAGSQTTQHSASDTHNQPPAAPTDRAKGGGAVQLLSAEPRRRRQSRL